MKLAVFAHACCRCDSMCRSAAATLSPRGHASAASPCAAPPRSTPPRNSSSACAEQGILISTDLSIPCADLRSSGQHVRRIRWRLVPLLLTRGRACSTAVCWHTLAGRSRNVDDATAAACWPQHAGGDERCHAECSLLATACHAGRQDVRMSLAYLSTDAVLQRHVGHSISRLSCCITSSNFLYIPNLRAQLLT